MTPEYLAAREGIEPSSTCFRGRPLYLFAYLATLMNDGSRTLHLPHPQPYRKRLSLAYPSCVAEVRGVEPLRAFTPIKLFKSHKHAIANFHANTKRFPAPVIPSITHPFELCKCPSPILSRASSQTHRHGVNRCNRSGCWSVINPAADKVVSRAFTGYVRYDHTITEYQSLTLLDAHLMWRGGRRYPW